MASSKEIKEEYTSSLADLTFNSKPLISVLTMLAEENIQHASDIVEAIETHLAKVRTDVKLPILYLIDCIMKNVGQPYLNLFCQNIVPTFCNVFESVDERTRAEMFKLRQTWNDVLPAKKLFALDVQINMLDPAWPVTAQPPNNSIHLNPKFLMNKTSATTTAAKKDTAVVPPVIKPSVAPVISTSTATDLDPETLDMQKKLITKQKQLLELQQKKLELELLQTQVKLQEQRKNAINTSKAATSVPHNVLLKPEVAKQLVNTVAQSKANVVSTTNTRPKTAAAIAGGTLLGNQKTQNIGSGSAIPRIAPVNSALATASRPIRDPRLLRQQQKQPNVVNSNVQLESKPQIDPNNKIVNNKMSVRDHRNEPRLVNNKDDTPPSDKTKSVPHTFPKSRSKHLDSTRKTVKSSRISKTSDPGAKGESSKSSSSSSLDSPVKNKKLVSPTKLPSKYKKKEPPHSDKKVLKSPKSDSKTHKSDISATFKDLKVSTKNRNYMRRNRADSASPEATHDVDLRLGGPPEKQARMQGETTEDTSTKVGVGMKGMDVDLRQLPAVIGKKRLSTESPESTGAKKSKTEMFDVLFGHEDTDLRQLPVPLASPPLTNITTERPPTPPPPIISNKGSYKDNKEKRNTEDLKESPKKINLDVLRAKLASATGSDKLNILSKKKEESKKSDTDLRNLMSPLDSPDKLNKIIISPADEQCIKTGNMTKAQEKALMNKIIAQIETQKLRQAQRQESEHIGNISLQPISDDEFEPTFSDEEQEPPKKTVDFGDKDERVPPLHMHDQEEFPKYQRPMESRGDPRRQTWRGRRRPPYEGAHLAPPVRRPALKPPGPAPWMRPMNSGPWRPIGPVSNFGKPPLPDNFIPADDPIDLEESSQHPHEMQQDLVVDCAPNQDNHRTINIDGIPRDIRYYDEQAIIFLNWDDPREISFQNGNRRVIFDDKEVFVLSFNEPYREVCVNGNIHQIKFGAPTREFYVNGKWYEAHFGGPGLGIDLNGKVTVVKLEGPPPQVKIGTVKRTDLVCGKINLIIDAKSIVPVFLDATTQKFNIDGKTHTLRFVDSLRSVIINDVPFKVEFGGLPKPVTLVDRKHFIRFSVLPRGIKPGRVRIKDMEQFEPHDSPMHDENSQDNQIVVDANYDVNEPVLPAFNIRKKGGDDSPDRNSNSPHLFQNMMQQQSLNNLDVLSSVISSAMEPSSSNDGGYQVENITAPVVSQPTSHLALPVTTAQPAFTPAININDLFQKLVATGIVTTGVPEQPPVPQLPPQTNVSTRFNIAAKKDGYGVIRPVTFNRPETLKIRQPAVYQLLYSGMQCSSCGMRFPPEQSMHYSQHLDWHFRQNRKGKKNIRKAASRRWYYTLADWQNYEEIEDLEEREKSYFDQQQAQLEGANEEPDEEIEIPTIPADPDVQDAHCEICQDRFEQFYNEEKEEWQLRMAMRVNDKTYHPLCYEDYQASLNTPIDISATDDVPNSKELEEKRIPGLEIVLDDDDEENKEQQADTIESEDSKLSQEEVKNGEEEIENDSQSAEAETQKDSEQEEDDDDVIINEVVPIRIIVDDDDDNEENVGLLPGVTVKEEPIDDGFMDVEGGVLKVKEDGEVKIKSEPTDLDDTLVDVEAALPTIEPNKPDVDTTHAELVSSIDGNVELDMGTPATTNSIGGKIKINISKPLPVLPPKETKEASGGESEMSAETFIDPSQPLPPGEEPIQLNVKPALQGIELKKMPAVKKGSELTGLCSIM